MKHYTSKEVTCPFYTYEDGLSIFCEGAVPDASSTKTTFRSRQGFSAHKHEFCNVINRNSNCPIYHAINSKY